MKHTTTEKDLALGMDDAASYKGYADVCGTTLTSSESGMVALFERICELEEKLVAADASKRELSELLSEEIESHMRKVGGVDLT